MLLKNWRLMTFCGKIVNGLRLRSHLIPQLSKVHSGNHLLCLHKRTIENFKEQLKEIEAKGYF